MWSVQRIERRAGVFVQELLSLVPLLEEVTTAFSILTETQVGHVTDDHAVSLEWGEVCGGRSR
jgi:hypothetical protein